MAEEPVVIEIVKSDGAAMLIPEEAKSGSPSVVPIVDNAEIHSKPMDAEVAEETEEVPPKMPCETEAGSCSQKLPHEIEVNLQARETLSQSKDHTVEASQPADSSKEPHTVS